MPKAPAQQPGKGARPWVQQAPSQVAGRKLVYEGRIVGTAQEWNNTWGWIKPLQKITHPQFRGNKLYCHTKDVKIAGGVLTPGVTVSFLLYADSRGLGAGDVQEVDPLEDGTTGVGVADAAEDGALPEGWEEVWSDEHGEYYYWNSATKESSWVLPEASDEAQKEDEDEAALPEGWSKNFDPEHNEYYYWHAPTKTTTWERPRVAKRKPAASEEADGEEAPGESGEAEAPADADGPALGQRRARGCVEKWQGFFGWITPSEDLGEDVKALLGGKGSIYCNWRDLREGTKVEVGSLVDFLLYADGSGLAAIDVRLQEDAEREEEEKARRAAADLKPAKRGRKRGRQNNSTDAVAELERQWAEQDAKLGVGAPAEDDTAAEPSHGVAELPDLEDDLPLLPGWEQHWSEEHSCFYYWHKATKQASWERPCMPGGAERKEDKIWEGEGAQEGAAKLATPITPVASWAGKDITPLTPATGSARVPTTPTPAAGGAGRQPSAAPRVAQASARAVAAKPASAAKRPGAPWQPKVVGGGGGKGGAWTPGAPGAAAKKPRAR